MGGSVDDFVREIKEQILEETKEAYGEVAYQRWQNPTFMGAMKDPDGHGRQTGVCGDSMEIFLKFENDRVKEASFVADGCGSSTVCGSFAAEMAIGKNTHELLEITAGAIIKKMGGIPKEDEHIALLAAETVHEALNDYLINRSKKAT
jgi:nitrogen fixation NifU-like protein